MRGLGMPFLLRRARSSWLLLACIAVTVLLVTGLAAVLWTFAAASIPPGALNILAAPQGRVVGLSGVADPRQAAADSRLIRTTLREAWPGVGFQLESALWAEPLQLPSPSASTNCPPGEQDSSYCAPPTISQIQVASLEAISAQATLTAGEWPGPPQHGDPLPVALPAAAASQLHLTLGSVVTAPPERGGAPISLRVTGLFRATDPASPYWTLDLLPASGISDQNLNSGPLVLYGPAVVNPAAFGSGLAADRASWMVLPQAPALASLNANALAASTNAAFSQLNVVLPEGLQVTSGLPQLLADIVSTSVLTRSLFTIAALLLLLVAGAGLVLAARLLASRREEESALLRARGATRWQLARPVLAEAMVLGAGTALAGVLAGTRLAGAVASLGNLRLDGYTGRGVTPLAWLSALAMLVLCVAVMARPALHAMTPGAARLRRGRPARLAGIAWAGGDLAVVALAAVSVWQLRDYSAVAHVATGSLGIDPVVAIAPALALAGVALIPVRGLPLLARLADKATDHERRLTAPMVSWEIARRSIRQTGPALLVVVATATTTLALAGYASWRQSAADQTAFTVGSDVRVDAGGAQPLGASGSAAQVVPAGALSLGGDGAISGAPGVTAATPASLTTVTNFTTNTGVTSITTSGHEAEMIALDANTAGKTILLRPDLSSLPLSTLWQRITPSGSSGLVLPGQPDRLEVLATLGAGPNTSAAEVRKAPGSATLTAWVSDAADAVYGIQAAGSLPFDGQPHSLVFTLSDPGQASYPLRLIGLTLTYILPPYDTASPSSALTARLSIESLAVAATASGPLGKPFCQGAALAAWEISAISTRVPDGPEIGSPSNGDPPAIVQSSTTSERQLIFTTGHDPSRAVMQATNFNPVTATGQVAILAEAAASLPSVPVIATAGYLAANQLRVGSVVSVSINGLMVPVQIVASVARFPTVFGPNLALIADLATVDDVLVFNHMTPLPVTRWWLSTVDGRVPRLPAGLGLSVTVRASQRAALLDNVLLAAPRQAMLAVGLAAVVLGVLGFSTSVAASLRSRRTQGAVFAALGVGKNAQAGQLCLEQCALSVPAAAAGLLAGIGLAHVLVPAITLTTGSTEPVPSVLVIVPLGPAVALALVTAAGPAVAAALSVLRRPDPAARLRAEGG